METKSKTPTDVASSETGNSNRKPEVIVEFLFDRGVLSIAVNNIGDGAAYKISVNFDQKILGLGGERDISTMALFKNVEFLGPRREITTLVDTSYSYFKRKQPERISAQVTYHDSQGRAYKTTVAHDLRIYRDLTYTDHDHNCCN
jgi:hypothetical protein